MPLRVLLDESVPRGLRSLLPDHQVSTVQEMGWAGIENGELVKRAGEFAVFVTADRSIEHQQNLAALEVGIVLLVAKSNEMEAYLPLADNLVAAVKSVGLGELIKIAAQQWLIQTGFRPAG